MQQRIAAHFLNAVHLLQEPGKLLDVPVLDLGDFVDLGGVVLVVRKVVMPFRNAKLRKRAVVAIVGGSAPGRLCQLLPLRRAGSAAGRVALRSGVPAEDHQRVNLGGAHP